MQSLLQKQQIRLLKDQKEQEKRIYEVNEQDLDDHVHKKSKTEVEVSSLANKIKQKFSKKK